jgi:hypothetical protein
MAEFRLDVVREPGLLGGDWVIALMRQERPYARWKALNRAQGKTLSVALAAMQHGCLNQEKQHPELWQ